MKKKQSWITSTAYFWPFLCCYYRPPRPTMNKTVRLHLFCARKGPFAKFESGISAKNWISIERPFSKGLFLSCLPGSLVLFDGLKASKCLLCTVQYMVYSILEILAANVIFGPSLHCLCFLLSNTALMRKQMPCIHINLSL